MKIYEDRCIACENCVPYCPMGAIEAIDGSVVINQDECVECGICLRMEVCPVDALYEPKETMDWPRSVRKVFSNPTSKHEGTGVRGRGTEEVKTNDVTARYKRGFIGVALEFGRPGVGTKLSELEPITKMLAGKGIEFESQNPVISLMEDAKTGIMKDEVKNEKVMSAIVEFLVAEEKIEDILTSVREEAEKINTVFSCGLVSRFDEDGNLPVVDKLERIGYKVPKNMKVNVGLGKPKREE